MLKATAKPDLFTVPDEMSKDYIEADNACSGKQIAPDGEAGAPKYSHLDESDAGRGINEGFQMARIGGGVIIPPLHIS